MEKNFYPDNFERLLKESADNFRMYPSKRVWHGIYNDLHPSRKWPSLVIWILLISSIVYIGMPGNNHSLPVNNQVAFSENKTETSISSNNRGSFVKDQVTTSGSNYAIKLNSNTQTNPVDAQEASKDILNDHASINSIQQSLLSGNLNNKLSQRQPEPVEALNSNTNLTIYAILPGSKTANPVKTQVIQVPGNENAGITDLSNLVKNTNKEPGVTDLITKKADADSKNKSSITEQNIPSDKEWIEDHAFYNKPNHSKWKNHVTYQFYFTPSIGYRILNKNSGFSPVYTSILATSGNELNFKKALSQSAAINMEIGGNLLYSISKNWNLKAGIQLNYTNYNINAYELKHPTMTTIMLNDLNTGLPELDPRPTTLANLSGVVSKKLNNNTYQVSLPLGADLKLAGKDNLKWYAGATIQPTYVTGGNAYLVSTDMKHYVSDNSMIRNWNLNAAFETFISYKTKGGLTINAGPQVRYQLFSTYSKQYTYNEKLYNIGLKIGIITKF